MGKTISQLTALGAAPQAAAVLEIEQAGASYSVTYEDIKDDILADVPAGYSDEQAQDAVGGIVDATLVYVDGTPILKRAPITGDVSVPDGSNTATLDATAVLNLVFTTVARGAAWAWTTTASELEYLLSVSDRWRMRALSALNVFGKVEVSTSHVLLNVQAVSVETQIDVGADGIYAEFDDGANPASWSMGADGHAFTGDSMTFNGNNVLTDVPDYVKAAAHLYLNSQVI